ncbi:MAG: site-specific DNA-methyltransferase, partial [Cyanobacteria bacterium J06629_18]
ATSIPEILQLIPPTPTVIDVESVEVPEPELKKIYPATDIKVEAGWYVLEGQHLVFCGDTAAPEFHSHIPDVSLAVAATSNNWDHDWLIDVAQTLIVLEESVLQQNKLEQLINMFSLPGEAIVFPWLPYPEMIAIANKFNRKVIAGDMSQERCQQAISASGLDFASVQL